MNLEKLISVKICISALLLMFISCTNQNNSNKDIANHSEVLASEEQQIQLAESDSKYNKEYFATLAKNPIELKIDCAIVSILEDSNQNIWIGSLWKGVHMFNGESMKYFLVKDDLRQNKIKSILEDFKGDIWFETKKGISKFYTDTIISVPYQEAANSKSNWQIGKNDVWFNGDSMGSHDLIENQPGVYRYDGTKFNYCIFPMKRNKNPFYSEGSTTFIKGRNKMIWFGIRAAVIGYDGKSFNIIDNKRLGLNSDTGYLGVQSIFEDSKGNLWIGNERIGVILYSKGNFTNFSREQGFLEQKIVYYEAFTKYGKKLRNILAIGEDKNGNIWFGDYQTGAWRYDGQSLTNFTKADGLTHMGVWSIYRTKSGEMLFGMGDGNVCWFNGKSFEIVFKKKSI